MAFLTPTDLLHKLFETAVAAADPMQVLPRVLGPRPPGRVVVIGAGKASARMAEAIESLWGPCEGLVITRYGHARPCQSIEIIEASHPVPDAAGVAATRRMLDLLRRLAPGDFVLALISGGGSALLCAPAEGLTLAEKQAVTTALLASGAPIEQINTVRKHLSAVKGGQLAAAAFPARMRALLISDVAGDDPSFIASGPTVGDGSTPADALKILQDHRIEVPQIVLARLRAGSGVLAPGALALSRCETVIVAAPAQSLEAAAAFARGQGVAVRLQGDALTGEAADLGAKLARMAQTYASARRPGEPPLVLLSGGECTVSLRGTPGLGGPNVEFLLSALRTLDAAPGIWALAADTDGVDGAAEVAGAVIGPDSLAKARARGLDPAAALAGHDAHRFFAALGTQVKPGPTLTNVNDFRAFLIL
ncbi:glycerate kinase [Rhodobacter capsulatus]|uniref:glycerate kinase type-2 family protein n=1 Tax=Rhodobacter capsulatus TaxID=1061 RepID=UPI0009BF8F68|nr:glycerate kinase [Rhodobacter capsulatus]PZX23607.1 hydroxypyruvate reductase [Rhodobacter capsulatus]QNR62437.1 glycerate kinase [Rhodobacter capsulatus]